MEYPEKNVRDYGVIGNSVEDDYPAFQKALDSRERYLYVPYGKYKINGSLKIKSNTHLRLHPEAEIIYGDGSGKDRNSYLLSNYPNAENITVDGGIWNGNAIGNPRVVAGPNDAYLGVGIGFNDCRNLHLKNLTVRDTEAFHIRLNYVKEFIVENITFDDMIICFTQDGIHIAGGCEDGVIRHIRARGAGSPNDDMIALISDITDLNMSPIDPARGQRDGDIRNINIYDVKADNAFSFMRLFSQKMKIENIRADGFRGGCYYIGLQMQITPYIRNNSNYKLSDYCGVGEINNVEITDWEIYHRYPYGLDARKWDETDINGLIDIEENVTGLKIENFTRLIEKDNMPWIPTINVRNTCKNRFMLLGGSDTRISTGQYREGDDLRNWNIRPIDDSITEQTVPIPDKMRFEGKLSPSEQLKVYGSSIRFFELDGKK